MKHYVYICFKSYTLKPYVLAGKSSEIKLLTGRHFPLLPRQTINLMLDFIAQCVIQFRAITFPHDS